MPRRSIPRPAYAIAVLATCFSLGSAAGSEPPQPDAQTATIAEAGFWPTQRMVELYFKRQAGEIAHEFGLDESQADTLERLLTDRWPKFLAGHRPALQPLINEFIEFRLTDQPPDGEAVKRWAERADEVFAEFQKEVEHTVSRFRAILRPEQQLKLELHNMELAVGMQAFQANLKRWQKGEYIEREFWDPPPTVLEARRRQKTSDNREKTEVAEPASAFDMLLGEWDRYVQLFIEYHSLNEAQQLAATSILHEIKSRAVTYRDAHAEEFKKLDQLLADSNNPQRAAHAWRQMELQEPLAEMFDQLKNRLQELPTEAQIKQAEQEHPASPSTP